MHCTQAVRRGIQAALCYTSLSGGVQLETRFLDDLNRKVAELIAASPAKDVEKNLRALLSSAFSRLDLVTHEEFDIQQQVLGRTREKLQQLEARVAQLEKLLAGGCASTMAVQAPV